MRFGTIERRYCMACENPTATVHYHYPNDGDEVFSTAHCSNCGLEVILRDDTAPRHAGQVTRRPRQ